MIWFRTELGWHQLVAGATRCANQALYYQVALEISRHVLISPVRDKNFCFSFFAATINEVQRMLVGRRGTISLYNAMLSHIL